MEENPDLKLVIKPIAGAEGRGVGLISWNNGAIKRNSQHMTLQAFREYISGLDNYFISEFIGILQHLSELSETLEFLDNQAKNTPLLCFRNQKMFSCDCRKNTKLISRK